MRHDYDIEFYDTIELIIRQFVQSNNLPSSFKTFMLESALESRHEYYELRKSGIKEKDAESHLRRTIIPGTVINKSWLSDGEKIDLSSPLKGLDGRIISYVYNNEQLNCLLPIITALNRPSVLLCESYVNLEIDVPEYIVAIELESTLISDNQESTVPKSLAKFRNYYRLFNSILDCLEPECVTVLMGCRYQEHILCELATNRSIPSIAIPQRSPSLINPIFKDFPYKYILTWGDKFNELWRMNNHSTQYIAVGYAHKTLLHYSTNSITFILQAQLLISDQAYLEDLISLISNTAERYPTRQILIGEHPERKLPLNLLGSLTKHENIIFVSDWPLEETFAHSIVVVSYYSTPILECIAHGCIPIAYDPNKSSMESSGTKRISVGEVANTTTEFFQFIDTIFEHSNTIHKKISNSISDWFAAIGDDALYNITKTINMIAPSCQVQGYSKLNLGCGRNLMDGWLNCDLFISHPNVFQMDASRNYPFQDDSFDFIFSEHMFEHLTLSQQANMLRECYRVLKPGGVIRLAMPDMNFLMDLYTHPEEAINKKYIDWSFKTFVYPKCQLDISIENKNIYVINNFMRDWNHQFIHTPESLVEFTREIGFVKITKCEIGESVYPELSGMENHTNEIPEWANTLETFVIEATKPSAKTICSNQNFY